jgi:hypothetical protein
MCVLIYCTTLSETFHILRSNQRDIVKNVETSSCQVPVIFVCILVKFELYGQIFEKVSNIKFYQNPSSGSRVFPCGLTDMTDKAKRIVAFRNFAKSANKWRIC